MPTLLSYLALGDSYTIGEQVSLRENFPYQLTHYLRQEGFYFSAPEIVARTGWTTDELKAALMDAMLLPSYDLVTLLIGVNNQYRGRTTENYKEEFTRLLNMAIGYAGRRPSRVVAISIPDWSVTPFAEGRNRQAIAGEINAFNRINETISNEMEVHYVEITSFTREATGRPDLLTADGLHPSALDYTRWAKKITQALKEVYQ